MRPRRRVLLALVLLATTGCTTSARPPDSVQPSSPQRSPAAALPLPAPATAALAPDQSARLQAVLDKVVGDFETIPEAETAAGGITAALLTDRWAWTGAAGVDGAGTSLLPTTELAIASITKTFVAAEVLRLAGAGTVDLDAPLSTYVRHRLTANGATVRQHLGMRSGVPDYGPADYRVMDRAITAAPNQHWTPVQALARYTGVPRAPGGQPAYSNPSYVLLGMLLEKVTRQPLATVLRRDLIGPAGLGRIVLQDAERPHPPVAYTRTPLCPGAADGYVPCRAAASVTAASGGMAADAATVARWGYQLYGGRVLPPPVVAEMTGGAAPYGLGTERFSNRFGIDEAFGHRGLAPGHTSLLVVMPGAPVSVAVLVAGDEKNAAEVVTRLLAAVQGVR